MDNVEKQWRWGKGPGRGGRILNFSCPLLSRAVAFPCRPSSFTLRSYGHRPRALRHRRRQKQRRVQKIFSGVPPTPSHLRKMEDKTYSLRMITPEDRKDVVEFLIRFFFIDEPLNIETGMDLDYKKGKRCPELEKYCTDCIEEGNSVMAVSSAGVPVGVCINGGTYRNAEENSDECSNEKFKKVLVLLSVAEKQTDIFNKYPLLGKLLNVKIISVDSNWRGQGICKALLLHTLEIAREQNFQMVKVDCTSHISALAVERLGFKRIHVLKYADHVEEGSDRPVFNPPPPHYAVQIYIYEL